MKTKRKNTGFTLAELLIVVAIIAILVAISIPIFTAQRNKAVRAVNQANIRAAKAAAVTELYGGDAEYLTSAEKSGNKRNYIFFRYDVSQDKIVECYKNPVWDTINALAKEEWDKASANEKCDNIYVYLEPQNADKENDIQTAPYYTEDGKVGPLQGRNPFGPRH